MSKILKKGEKLVLEEVLQKKKQIAVSDTIVLNILYQHLGVTKVNTGCSENVYATPLQKRDYQSYKIVRNVEVSR